MLARNRFTAIAAVALVLAACSERQIPTEIKSTPQAPQAGLSITGDDPLNVSLTVDGTNATVDYDGYPTSTYKINFACATPTSAVNVNGRPTDAGVCATSPSAAPLHTGPGPVAIAYTGGVGNVLWACVRLQNSETDTDTNAHPWNCKPGTPAIQPCPTPEPGFHYGPPPECQLISNDVEQLITVPSGTKVYGSSDWTIVAHTNAPIDLLVSVTGDGCSQVGDAVNAPATGGGTDATITLHVLQVGSCTIEAGNLGGIVGDDNWLGNSAQGEWTVTPADLTVTTDNKTCQYGSTTPAFTGTISTVYYSDGITASWSSTATCGSPVSGSPYAIVATVNDPNNRLFNYNLTSSDGTLTVTPAPLLITAANKTMYVGNPVPSCTIASYVAFVNGDSAPGAVPGLVCTYTGPAANAVTTFTTYTGVYRPSGAVNTNYNISYAFGNLSTLGKCTFSQGYFKTHAGVWASASLPAVPGYPTYTTQTLWLKLFNTSPKGNQTIIRAYQWMAAWLNINVQGATDTNPSILGATATQLEAFNAGASHCVGDTSPQ